MSSVISQIQSDTKPVTPSVFDSQVKQLVDEFGIGLRDGQRSTTKRKRRGLEEEITYWEEQERHASEQLNKTSSTLPKVLEQTQDQLQTFLSSAQSLSLDRYDLADKLTNLVGEISEDGSILQRVKALQQELGRLEAGLAWVSILERVTLASENSLSALPRVAGIPHYKSLHDLVELAKTSLPDVTLVRLIVDIRDKTWTDLRELMSKDLIAASEAINWPQRVEYTSVPAPQRRAFERAYQDLLYLQSQGESLRGVEVADWTSGNGIYPLQALIQPIALRFRYHFQGARNTNRADKPEWGFAHILDQIYQHQSFIQDYLQPLTTHAGLTIDVQSEFTMLLLPILLSFLRSRIPKLMTHPALLAHTIYQTVLFDETLRENGFDLAGVSIYEDDPEISWEGLAGVILREEDWYKQWLEGERKFAESQLQTIIASSEAWTILDEGERPTISSRQIKSLIEQITDRYSPLPSPQYQVPFLSSIQIPILTAYLSRVSGSLDAFETLSSSFVRSVPGALAGNSGNIDQAKLTGGSAGLLKLCKAHASARCILGALRLWADDIFFVELSAESGSGSLFDSLTEKYQALTQRAEEMIVRHVTMEVEMELKQHLTRRWDPLRPSESEYTHDASLTASLTTLTNHLTTLTESLRSLTILSIYRKTVAHLTNHITQRAVFSGWSKFSQAGGVEFANEIQSWIAASARGLQSARSLEDAELDIPVEGPWTKLEGIAKILSLGVDEGEGEEVAFSEALAAAWGNEEAVQRFCEKVGVEMGLSELQAVLRRREECRK